MTRARPLLAAAVLLAATTLATACGGDDTGGPSDVTLPSSLVVTTSEPGSATTTAPPPPTTSGPAGDGTPVIDAVTAESAGECVEGTTSVTVSFEVGAEPPVRVFTVFLDGEQAGSSTAAEPITAEGIPCDGAAHTVLLIATGTNGRSATQAVAFLAPGPV